MKLRIIIPLIISLFPLFIFAESKEKGKIGLTYSLNGSSGVMPSQSLIGAASDRITHASGFGLIYLYPINNWLEWETGINYSLFKIETTSAPMPEVFKRNSTLSLIDIPIGVRANFLKYAFVNGGFLLDLNMMSSAPISDQTGIGMMLGVGLKYDFNFGGSIFIYPYGKIHSLLPFGPWENHDRILESGFRFGITYKL